MAAAFFTLAQICERYNGRSPRTIHRWRDAEKWDNPFPAPAIDIHTGKLWRIRDVIAWERAGGLKPKDKGQ